MFARSEPIARTPARPTTFANHPPRRPQSRLRAYARFRRRPRPTQGPHFCGHTRTRYFCYAKKRLDPRTRCFCLRQKSACHLRTRSDSASPPHRRICALARVAFGSPSLVLCALARFAFGSPSPHLRTRSGRLRLSIAPYAHSLFLPTAKRRLSSAHSLGLGCASPSPHLRTRPVRLRLPIASFPVPTPARLERFRATRVGPLLTVAAPPLRQTRPL